MSASTDIRSVSPAARAAGPWLVLAAAIVWSFGGLLARLADVGDPWVVIAWRTAVATACIAAFLLLRDGRAGTAAMARAMGWPGVAVGACFAIAMTSFVVALQYTTVANILLIQAGEPLIAALAARILLGEAFGWRTGAATAAVVLGIAIMVSESFGDGGSMAGNLLALAISVSFAAATVITRRHAEIRMTPAVGLGTTIACVAAVAAGMAQGSDFSLDAWQFSMLALFGGSLGLGLALFAAGARAVPSAIAALLGVAEVVLGPVWVWLALGETPSARAALGGGIVLAALLAHLGWQLLEQRRERGALPAAY